MTNTPTHRADTAPDVADRAGAAAEPAIRCTGLTKDYGRGHGLFDLDLDVRRGEVFGLIGANGAGKTTMIRLLMGLIRAARGTATLLGLDAQADSLALKRRIGYLPGELPRFPGVTAGYVVGLMAGLRGGVDPGRVSRLAERLELDLGQRFESLSHGNKQKVGLVQAFMHDPELLLLDEPTLGLDPLMQREFQRLLGEAARSGATVLLSSHVLAEVEQVCDRMGLIRAGRLLRVGSLEELRDVRVHRVEAVVPGGLTGSELARLGGLPGVGDAQADGDLVRCAVHGPITPLLQFLAARDVVELDSRELTLEEVFLSEFEPAS
jgi:ABC-2 type transport system ATP-binding protein